jgi:hypothetical protein
MNRRSILAAFAALGVAPKAAAVSVAEAISVMPVGAATPHDPMPVAGNGINWGYYVAEQVRRKREQARAGELAYALSNEIASKRSWSPAFKLHCHQQDEQTHRALIEQLEWDNALSERIAAMMGLTP